jgi:hypothetical protein
MLSMQTDATPRAPAYAAVFLASRHDAIVSTAEGQLAARSPRYAHATEPVVHERLTALYTTLTAALASRNLQPLLEHARSVADERFHAGYDLSDVQKAYNAVEEAIWSRVFAEGLPDRYAVILPCVSTAIGSAKDELAREYVRLAAGTHATAIDVAELFRG